VVRTANVNRNAVRNPMQDQTITIVKQDALAKILNYNNFT